MSGLSTHVLDTSRGRPAAGMKCELSILEGERWKLLKAFSTNADGRCDDPLLEAGKTAKGDYQLLFHVGAYFKGESFYDVVPVRFRIADTSLHYHVPLLVAPWGYSTYRGS